MTNRSKIYLKFLLFLWLAAIVFRLGFMAWQWPEISNHPWSVIGKAFFIGMRFDGRIAALISLPMAFALFTPFLWRFFAKLRPFVLVFYAIIFLLLFFGYFVDFSHYAYLQIRANYAALSLAADVNEAIGMVWQSYPVIKLLLLILILLAIMIIISMRILRKWDASKSPLRTRIISGVACFFIFALLCYGQYTITLFPLRWSEAYFSGYNEITALGINPFQNLWDTTPMNNPAKDNTAEARAAYPTAAAFLGVDNPDATAEKLRYDRFSAATAADSKPNVVIIVIESMSSSKSTLMFPELDTTPFLKELADSSLYFPNYYASARTTARSMFSIVSGVPDVNTSFETSSRDPNVMDQHVVWNEFDGYEKLYMLGGSANWANIRGVMTNNVLGIRLYEEGYWKSPVMDVWGVSDMDLLQEANQILEQETEPFVALIQLASFHRPFTVPDGLEGFDYSIREDYADYGFAPEEYLSMKFCDYAIRKYFEAAKQAGYYENTIFVVTGDHGISEKSPKAGENYQNIRLHEFQVPLIISYPKAFSEPQLRPESGGHVDLFPTVASIAGIEYQNTTLGRNLLDERFGADRYTFIRRQGRPPMMVNGTFSFSQEYDGKGQLYIRPAKDVPEWYPTDQFPEVLAELEKLVDDIEQTAIYMLYHNSKADADALD
ncbi:MAG: LTA synthase family protein [Deferribacteraceae bacterium]|jgi:phosphoglycerol transferase MdoB-like AlkP superfamily enzyme|nr:LTA synthase family protein [Deferribacteraceae bacterium]